MAFQDNNPERRNLTVLSLCIILFYLAEGELCNGTVKLQVINVNFNKPEVLTYFIWVFLAWFCFRYWLVNQGIWKENFYQELTKREEARFIYYRYIVKRFNLSNDYNNAFYRNSHWVKFSIAGKDKVVFQHLYKGSNGDKKNKTIKLSTALDKLILCICALFMFFRRPSLSGYFTPYFMFVWALILIVYHIQ